MIDLPLPYNLSSSTAVFRLKDPLVQIVFQFLKLRKALDKPLLLAISGGPDSLALLYILNIIKESYPIKVAIAHVDHGWRKESSEEARELKKRAEAFGFPFHLKILSKNEMGGNLEAFCREERLCFFITLCQKNGYLATLLAHHADDHAETVLKRIFEGAPIVHLGGISEEKEMEGVLLWRPLLTVTKKQILSFLEKMNLKGFDDITNRDTKFLRARMREELLPYLSNLFGKEISSGLCYLGQESKELIQYLNDQVAPFLSLAVRGPFGSLLDMSGHLPCPVFEIKHLIRLYFKEEGVSLSRESLEKAVRFLVEGRANIYLDNNRVLIDRYKLFRLLPIKISLPDEGIDLPEEGSVAFGGWHITVEKRDPERELEALSFPNWESVFKGAFSFYLPKGVFRVVMGSSDRRYKDKTTLNRHWNHSKVPHFLQNYVPIIEGGGDVQQEFLSGYYQKDFIPEKKVSFTFL